MTHTYKKEDGTQEEVSIERWAWSVLYKPTEEQTAMCQKLKQERQQALIIERNQSLVEARKLGSDKDDIKKIYDEYDTKFAEIIEPDQDQLDQFDSNGIFHRFAEIDWSRVQLFAMQNILAVDEQSIKPSIAIEYKSEMQVFHVYKRFLLRVGEGKSGDQATVYCFGWKNRETGAKTYNYILPNDKIITSSEEVDLTKYVI